MNSKSLVSINDFSKEEYLKLMDMAAHFEANPNQDILRGKVIAVLFFEPSTRTRLSFESAIHRLGGSVIGFAEAGGTSVAKGESLKDTIKTISKYADLIVMRHPVEGSARYASELSPIPVINAGDGANQHPTQCLLDLFSIKKTQGTLQDLNMVFVGDLKYGRTVHSNVIAMSNFNCTYHLVSPIELKLPSAVKMHIKEHNLNYYQYTDMMEAIPLADIIYMTRIQQERFADPLEYEKVKNSYNLKSDMLKNVKSNMKILHPLPRLHEINADVDDMAQAYYFDQALNGVYMRQALMSYILGLK